MDVVQYAFSRPSLVALEDRRPRWKIMGELPPRCASARAITNRVHELARVVFRLLKVRYPDWRGDHLGDDGPLVVGQIGRIAAPLWTILDSHAARVWHVQAVPAKLPAEHPLSKVRLTLI
jgi:hypothetical protein